MSNENDFTVKFWGVRGSIACPGHDFARYGGNTSCLEIRCGSRLLIFDAGTGLRSLGASLCSEQNACGGMDFDIFLTHTHIDHIAGIPFFGPFFDSRNKIRLHAGNLAPERSLKNVLCTFMADPIFPVPPEIFDADAEHLDNGPDPAIAELIAGADYVIYDCSYTDEEYQRKFKGWGHSTWQEGLRLVAAAGAKNLVIFHHDPSHDDAFMDEIAAQAAALRPGTVVAREGLVLSA